MGIYSRDYIREDRGGLSRSDASAIPWLIGINVAVYLAEVSSHGRVNDALGLSLTELWPRPELWRLMTYGFCHGSTGHIFFNMYALWLFGKFVEPIYGAREFVAFYLMGILISGLAFLGFEATLPHPAMSIGASGGVMAVTLAAAWHFPTVEFLLLFVIPIQLKYLALLTVFLDVTGMFAGGTHVAHAAHLGGAAFGFLYARNGWRVLSWLPTRSFRWPKSRPKVRIFEPDEEDTRVVSEETVDALLRKISEQGEASLTDDERSLLATASRQAARRRKSKL